MAATTAWGGGVEGIVRAALAAVFGRSRREWCCGLRTQWSIAQTDVSSSDHAQSSVGDRNENRFEIKKNGIPYTIQ